MNRSLIIVILIFICVYAKSQTENFSSLNMFNHMFYNPGYAGDGNDIESKIFRREQWLGFDGRPVTTNINIDAPFRLFGFRHGAAICIIQDKIGYFTNQGATISYAYRKPLPMGELGIGVGFNFINQKYGTEWRYPGSDTGSSPDDPGVPKNSENQPWIIDGNIGMFYRSDNMYLSASIKNFAQSKIKYKSAGTEGESGDIDPSYVARQVFFGFGYEYQMPNPMFSFKPSLYLGSDFSSTMISASGLVTYNNRIFGGLAYKPFDDIGIIAGLNLPSGLEVAVSYDYNLGRLSTANSGSVEFMLGYSFSLDMDKDIRKYKSVRFL